MYLPHNVFNIDDLALFLNAVPLESAGIHLQGRRPARKQSKARVAMANADDSSVSWHDNQAAVVPTQAKRDAVDGCSVPFILN